MQYRMFQCRQLFQARRSSDCELRVKRIRLIHWNAAEGRGWATVLEAAGYAVDIEIPKSSQFVHKLRENSPHAVVIDLSRLPSQGRDMGLMLRQFRSTRFIPLIFVEGDPKKVERIKKSGLLFTRRKPKVNTID